jgi:hypothetical protein
MSRQPDDTDLLLSRLNPRFRHAYNINADLEFRFTLLLSDRI